MNYLKLNEKLLKHNLKNKKRITLSLVVTFLITGGLTVFEDEVLARDLRARKANTVLNVDNRDPHYAPTKGESANKTPVVNIVNPNENGLSHNKFIDFSVGDGDNVIFNNNMEHHVDSKTGGLVFQNTNLKKQADTILTEVTGTQKSDINGTIEIAGKRADFILANENGITVNGGGFINTNGVTLATGKPTVSGKDVNFDVTKGNVLIEGKGVGTAGDYFNIIAKTIELKGQIAPFEGQNDADITLIAGSNQVNLKDGKTPELKKVLSHDKGDAKYGIYGDKLGAMYGKNIKLISTTEGLGVKHEGLIRTKEDIHIQSNGDIEVAGLRAERNIKLEGKGNLKTLNGVYKIDKTNYNYSIMADKGVELYFDGNITLDSFVSANGQEGLKIKANDLKVLGDKKSTAGIFSQSGLVIKLRGDMNVDALLQPVRKNGSYNDAPLLVEKLEDGTVVVKDPITGDIIPESEYSWEGIGITGEFIEIDANSLTNKAVISNSRDHRDSKITLNIKDKLTNKNSIYSSGTLTLNTKTLINEKDSTIQGAEVTINAENITNEGELRQNIQFKSETVDRGGTITINFKNGTFTNKGTVSGYNVDIKGEGFKLENTKDGKIIASTEDYPRGMGKITISVKDLKNEGIIQSYGKGTKNDIVINTETLSNILGHIVAQKGTITINSKGEVTNTGEIYADKDVSITSENGNINNNGGSATIGSGTNITIKAEKGKLDNRGKIAAAQKLMVTVNELLNAGSSNDIREYLTSLYGLTSESYEEVEKLIAKFEEEVKTATGEEEKAIREKLDYFKGVKDQLAKLNQSLEVLKIGAMSGKDIEINAKTKADNNGLIKAENDLKITSQGTLSNNGILEGGHDVTLNATGDITNSQRIYAGNKLDITGKSFTSTGEQELLKKYADIMSKYTEKGGDEKLKEIDKEVEKILKELKEETNPTKVTELKTKLDGLRKEKQELSNLKAQISTIRKATSDGTTGKGLGTIEAGDISINATGGDIKNDGVIVTHKDLTLNATGDITNSGNISVGKSANITGKSFKNTNEMSVVEKLTAKVQNAFESKVLKVGKDLELEAREAKFTDKLDIGGKADITLKDNGNEKAGNVTFGKDEATVADQQNKNDINVSKDLTIKGGGLVNKLLTAIGGNLTVDKDNGTANTNAKFENSGKLNVTGNATIDTNTLKNTKDMVVGQSLDIDTTGKFENSGKLHAGGADATSREEVKVDIKSNGLSNTGDMVFGTDTNINFGQVDNGGANFESKNLEVKGNLEITGKGDVTIQENGKLQSSGKTTINTTGNVDNKGNILNTELDIKGSFITNHEKGKIESTNGFTITSTNKGTGKIDNKGTISTTGKGSFDSNKFENSGTIKAGIKDGQKENGAGSLNIKVNESFKNTEKGSITGQNITVDGSKTENNGLKGTFDNTGTLSSNDKLTINYKNSKTDMSLNSNNMKSNGKMTIITGGDITVEKDKKVSNFGALDFKADGDITNKGQIVSNSDITLKGKNIINGNEKDKEGAVIWSFGNMVLEAQEKITNKFHSFIKAGFDGRDPANMTITSKELINEGSTIQATGNININADKVINKAITNGEAQDIKPQDLPLTNHIIKVPLDLVQKGQLTLKLPSVDVNGMAIKEEDKAKIFAGGDLTINAKDKTKTDAKTTIENTASTLQAGKGNVTIKGDLENKGYGDSLTIEEYFNTVQVQFWKPNQHGNEYNGSLKDFLIQLNDGSHNALKGPTKQKILNALKKSYQEYLKLSASGQLNGSYKGYDLFGEMMSMVDSNWQSNINLTTMKNKLNDTSFIQNTKKDYFVAGGEARVQAGKDIDIIGNYKGGEDAKKENSVETITIGGEKVDRTENGFNVEIGDPNSVTETDDVKQVHKVEVQTGQVTINGVTIDATTGGSLSSFAVAGTINPVIYIPIPQGNNGIFKPAVPKPGERVPYKYETNIDFIDPNRYFGSDYFFENSGLDRDEYGTVIGDAYYEKELISSTIKGALGYTGEITGDHIKNMLDNAIDIQDDLKLEVGKPLTPEQINNLEKDIVWYVEMEVEGDLVLVPQVYFGKDTRLEMAEADKGGGAGSTLKAGNDIKINGDNVTNNNGNIIAGGNVDIKAKNDIVNNATGGFAGGITAGGDVKLEAGKDITMSGGTVKGDKDVSLNAGGNIDIESKVGLDGKGNQIITNTGGVQGKGDVSLKAGKDVNVTGGIVESTNKGDVNISGENVNIKDQTLIKQEGNQQGDKINGSSYSKTESKSVASNVAGENVTIKSKNDTNIQGSNVVAGKDVNLEAGGNVNITDGKEVSHETSSSNKFTVGQGGLTIGSSSSEKTEVKSKGSTVGGLNGLNVKSGGDVTLKGSDMISGEGGINIESKGNVNIIDGQDSVKGNSHSNGFSGVSYSKNDKEYSGTTSKGSSLSSKGDINIKADGNVKSVGSDINSLKDTNINAKGDVKFEAGKNTYEEKSSSINVGVTKAGAAAGAGGSSASANWDPTNGASSEVVNGQAVEVSKQQQITGNSKGGKNYMDSLANAHTEIGVSVKKSEKKGTTWTEGEVNTGGDLNIKSGGTVDIGGSDFTTGGDLNITGKKVDTSKYEDVHEEKNDEFSLGGKIGNATTSNIADVVNKGMQIDENSKDPNKKLNEGLTGAQIAGSVSNMIFGDLAGNTTSVTGELKVNKSASKTSKENITDITSKGDINIKSTEGDITLNGVNAKGNDVSLDSAGNVNINSSKNTEKSQSVGFGASGGITGSVGVGAIDGAYAQAGVTGNASYNKSDVNNQTNTGSSISGNNISIKSKGDTNVTGSTVNADKDVNLDIGGNLNVKTETDKIHDNRTEGWAGLDVSTGGSSSTIVTGDVGLSAGGGQIHKNGDKVTGQAGITAKNSVNAEVKGDLNLKGGVLGSETGNGKLNVGGDLNVEDVKSSYNEGGSIIGGNVGTKGFGAQGEVGDIVHKDQTAKGTLGFNSGNVTVGGDTTVNGNKNTGENKLDGVNKDINNSITTEKDVTKGGGTFGITGSAVGGKGNNKKDDAVGTTPEFKIPRPEVVMPDAPDTKVHKVEVQEGPDKELPLGATPNNKGGDMVDGNANKPEVQPPQANKVETTEPEIKVPSGEDVAGGNANKSEIQPPQANKVETNKPEVQVPNTGGYVKDPETGKWVKPNTDGGAILTGGAISNKKALDGFKAGLESLKNGNTKVETTEKGPAKAPVTEGNYVKNPETGKWESTGSSGKPGAITTNGPFGSKGSLDGFQKGAESLNKNGTGDGFVKAPVTDGPASKAELVGGKGNTSGDKPAVPGGNAGVSKGESSNGGYVKNPETGKWESTGSSGKPGAITTNGPFGSKGSLDGFQKGAESLNKNGTGDGFVKAPVTDGPASKAELVGGKGNTSGDKPAVPGGNAGVSKGESSNGGYVKNPETGKWESTGSSGKPGAITTNGPFGSKGSLDGFQKGAESLNKNGTGDGFVKAPVTDGPASKAELVGGKGNTSGDKPAVPGGNAGVSKGESSNGGYVKNPETGKWESTGSSGKPGAITTNGPFGSKGSLDGFQKGAESLNKNGTGDGFVKAPVTDGPASKAELVGGKGNTSGDKPAVPGGNAGVSKGESSNGGYVKNPETGKWESTGSSGKPGAITTNGPFGSKGSLDGFQKGAESLNKNGTGDGFVKAPVTDGPASKAELVGGKGNTSGDKPAVPGGNAGVSKGESSNGGYVKNPETGKWESTGSSGKPGAITTNGPFGSKGSLDGFQKGAESLNKNGTGDGFVKAPVTDGPASKAELVGGKGNTSGDKPAVPGGNAGVSKGESSNGGYVKNPETGKWESTGSSGKPGAITTNGPFGSKGSLDGFQKGAESLNKNGTGDGFVKAPVTDGPASKAELVGGKGNTSGDKPAVPGGNAGVSKGESSNGGYVKNPETGKWESTGSSGKPGAITTNGPFGSKGSLDGFQKGAESLNKNGTGDGFVKAPVTDGPASKAELVGGKGNTSGDKPAVPGGNAGVSKGESSNGGYVKNPETGKWESTGSSGKPGAITTNGPFGSKGSLDGFQKGAESLNKNGTGDGFVKAPVTDGPASKAELVGGKGNTSGDKPAVPGGNAGVSKGESSNGGYVKNPETGKWESTGSSGKPGAITTNGPFGSKGSLDGFQKGAESLNKNGTGDGFVKAPVTDGPASKAELVGGKGNTSGDKPAVPGGNAGVSKGESSNGGYVKNPETGKWESTGSSGKPGAITTNGPFGSKGSLDGFQKGAESLNNTSGTTNKTEVGDKYDVLDKDNAFDFPQDDGTRVEIKDTANEEKIEPEVYVPLDAIPPKYQEGNKNREALEAQVETLLEKQKELSDKFFLTRKDKKELEKIEKELKGLISSINQSNSTNKGDIELPPVDYNDGVSYPPVDYNDSVDSKYPPIDYEDGVIYPPADYDNGANGTLEIPKPDYDKPKKNVNFNDKVEVKYIDDDSTRPMEGGAEDLKDEED